MKFITQDISGQGKTRLGFALGKQELDILIGLLDKALEHTPRLESTDALLTRMQGMKRELMNNRHRFEFGPKCN